MNKCIYLIKQWKEMKDKISPKTEVQSKKRTYSHNIDSRDLLFLDKTEKKIKNECWKELDADMMSRFDKDRWIKDLREGNNPRFRGNLYV